MTILSVPDMSCGHCKASVETALAPFASKIEVDLATRQVSLEGVAPEKAIALLDEIGFPAKLLP